MVRRGCHLCDDALFALRAAGVEPALVDIDLELSLLTEFDHRVPVLRSRTTGIVVVEGVIDDEVARRVAEGRWPGMPS